VVVSRADRNDDGIDRGETLAALPSLLALARQVVVAACDPRDPEIAALRALLEECVVGAHRVCLREQLRASDPAEAAQL
jgi:hypothetical protein